MKIYHGSNMVVKEPALDRGRNILDFGKAFYMTSDCDQAKKWAFLTEKRRKSGTPIINEFELDKSGISALKCLHFESADREWLKFVSDCRMNRRDGAEYDLITGPVANDQTINVIQLYMIGVYDEDEAIRRLLPFKLKNQYAFKSEKALALLTFKRSVYL